MCACVLGCQLGRKWTQHPRPRAKIDCVPAGAFWQWEWAQPRATPLFDKRTKWNMYSAMIIPISHLFLRYSAFLVSPTVYFYVSINHSRQDTASIDQAVAWTLDDVMAGHYDALNGVIKWHDISWSWQDVCKLFVIVKHSLLWNWFRRFLRHNNYGGGA